MLARIEDMTDPQEIIAATADPMWRIHNLYWIKDKDGRRVKFRPWPEQAQFLRTVWHRNVIPKARQRGFSTIVQIMMLDACVFNDNTAAAVIAQDDDTAGRIFNEKVRYAWENLPDAIKLARPLKYETKRELTWEHGSSLYCSTSTRGGTLQWLHISEFGIIALRNPGKAAEILEGSLPSVDQNGIIVVESTVESAEGPFAAMVKQALAYKEAGKRLTKLDYRLHFASWWDADEYEIDPADVIISPKMIGYFHRAEAAIGRPISPRKRAWYVSKVANDFGGDQDKMFRQYPTTLSEAFNVSTEGLWLSTQLSVARTERRILRLPIEIDRPVNTFWDIFHGGADDNAVWLHQQVGPWAHWIAYFESSSEPYSFIVRMLQEFQAKHGFTWGFHHLPHDGARHFAGAESLKTSRDMLESLGLRNFEIVPRISAEILGIEQLREAFPTYRFDEERCADGLTHLSLFSKKYNATMARWSDVVDENGHQHAAAALRQHAQWRHRLRDPSPTDKPRRGRRPGAMAV